MTCLACWEILCGLKGAINIPQLLFGSLVLPNHTDYGWCNVIEEGSYLIPMLTGEGSTYWSLDCTGCLLVLQYWDNRDIIMAVQSFKKKMLRMQYLLIQFAGKVFTVSTVTSYSNMSYLCSEFMLFWHFSYTVVFSFLNH